MKRKLVLLVFLLATALGYLAAPPTAVTAVECDPFGYPACSRTTSCWFWFFRCRTTETGVWF